MFLDKNKFKGIESFDPAKCKIEKQKLSSFANDDVAMGCTEGCWSSCIGGCGSSCYKGHS